MEEPAKDPLDISKEVELIKEAQKDLSKIDVLICGGCHEVFFFVEEFQKHKNDNECSNVSILKCENEEKTPIWGFTLWKFKQIETYKSKGEEVPSSWEIYQKWTKLEQHEKDLWITGGKTLQFINKISTGRLREIKDEKKIEKDPLAIDDEVIENEVSNHDDSFTRSGILKTVTLIKESKKAVRTNKDNDNKEEFTVEKIVGKRFNPRKRYWEYEVKWENYSDSTWEPLAHLENCKQLVKEFEDKLKAEKEAKEKEKTPGRGRGRPRLNPNSPQGVKVVKKPVPPAPSLAIISTSGGRPQRTSKQKALNQVKQWCGNMSDEEGGVKRPFADDADSDDSYEKKMKFDGDDDDTEEDEPRPPIRKIAKIVHTYNNNGAGKTTTTKLPDNVLIPDAKGVVRISQKQLPSLSSGVYIMSKSSGIIKLDPAASKIATSGGQAIVKVSPKIGQTQIKIIKKEDGSKRVVEVKKTESASTATSTTVVTPKSKIITPPATVNRTSILKKDIDKIVKRIEIPKIQASKAIEKKEEVKKAVLVAPSGNDDDSDDGIPDWEFPSDLPLPEPESPPREFTLDPFTGKMPGVEYPDPEPELIIKEEEKGESDDEKKEETPQSLEFLVKLATSDITEDDLKNDTSSPQAANENTPVTNASDVPTVNTPAIPVTVSVITTTIENVVKATPSILTTAIANSNILQKTLQSPSPRLKTQPRIINQSVAKPRTSMSPLVRNTAVRPKQPLQPKSKFNIAPLNPAKDLMSPQKPATLVKKVNNINTNVYKTKINQLTQVKKPIQKTITPKPVISMPSLDEEPTILQPTQIKINEEPKIETADLSTFTLATTDRPMFITGDDGTLYQVAGQNEEGQTILLTQDSEGQQQCLLVTSEALQDEGEQAVNPGEVQLMEVQEPVEVGEEQPLVAQFIRTEPPSPGGTHKVVVMLPDGDVMVTQVTPEEYASLELDK